MNNGHWGEALALFAGCTLAGLAAADAAIEEVIVTAQKRQETMQATPIALSVMSSEALEKIGAVDFAGVAAASPSVYFVRYPSSSTTLILFMRAQGNGDPAQITGDGAVGIYQDGIYLSRPQAVGFDLADIERVEVLRGPQGTLYGRNTTGGAVNIITKKPTGSFAFKQELDFGSRDLFRSLTTVDLPAWHEVAAKVTLLRSDVDGFVKNTGDSHDYGEQSQQAGRLALRWNAAANLVVDYALEAGELESTPAYYQNDSLLGVIPGYSISRDRTYRPVDLPASHARFEGHSLVVGWDLSDSVTLNSLTGYRKLKSSFYQDYAEVFFAPFTTDDLIKSDQLSQEFQLVGSLLDDRLKYAAGLYYFEETGSHQAVIDIAGGFILRNRDVTAESKSQAVYAQGTWTPAVLDDRLDLTLGGRYTRDDRSATRSEVVSGVVIDDRVHNDQDFSRFNPAFTANFRWTEDVSTYAKVTTGYRAGGSSESGADFTVTYDPEEVTSYEVGLKSYAWERRVRANLAVFYTDYEDIQISTSPDATDLSITQTVNAGEATISGAELDLLIAPIEDLAITLDYTYLDAQIDKVDVGGVDMARFYAIPFAPRHSYNVGIDYTPWRFAGGDLNLHADYRWQDDAFLSGTSGPAVPNGDYYARPSYGLASARITASFELPRGDRARVALWGKNLADKKYIAHAIGNGNLLGYTSQAYTLGEPRSYGISLVYEY